MKDRRKFLFRTLALGSLTFWPWQTQASSQPVRPLPTLKGRTILLTYGGWDGHEPEKFAEYLAPWMRSEGAEVILSKSLEPYANEILMNSVDLVVQSFTMAQITKEQEAGLLKAVKINRTGLAGWHGGLCDAFRSHTEYHYMTGGQWVAHPGGIIQYRVNITDKTDAVTSGISSFTIKDEQYYMHVDPNVKVLATSHFTDEYDSWISGSVMPVAWKKMYGNGRVFYSSLGHNLPFITQSPEALTLLKRGIQWASASKYEPAEKWVSPVYPR